MVALLGFHSGASVSLKTSGYSAPIGEVNSLTHAYYRNLLGFRYPNDTFLQVKASDAWYEKSKDNTTYDNIEWVHPPNADAPAMMMPTDMQIYLSFHVNSTGGTSDGEYCPQGNNETIYNCSDSSSPSKKYLPLSPNAPQAFAYAKDANLFIK